MRWLAVALFMCGCGGGSDVASAQMALETDSGLQPGDVAAVEILVLDSQGGPGATCARALAGATPLDDPTLQVVAHALFTVDGTAKHLSIPANRHLVFYAEAFHSTAPNRTRIGRGCAEQSLAAGASTSVMITLSSTD
jgi:hypothetical protein